MKLDAYPTSYSKINSKWIKDLNIKTDIVYILEEKIWVKLYDIGHSYGIYMYYQKHRQKQQKLEKGSYIKITDSAQQRK